ncbi:peptidase S8/S53 domain-containing protein, partial [Microdochium trichocladiopsis]
ALASLPQVAYIEPNYKVTTSAIVRQQNPPNWGLARISKRKPNVNNYAYDERAGAGSYAYIIDTGIYTAHPDFQGRATFGYSAIANQTGDGNGHGTHVAGIVGSATYGVAKKAQLIAVKVLEDDGTGFTDGVIQGLQWAVSNAQAQGRVKKSVINLSLAGPKSRALKDATNAAVAAGVFVAVAAGNANALVKGFSPANAKDACTVAATDINDNRADYSNFGKLVDIFAPGTGIVSTWKDGKTATLSGTSMASPHVAGLGAYMLSIAAYRTPEEMCKYLKSIATKGAVKNAGITKNKLAYNG